MIWAIIGILIGIVVGLNLTYTIPIEYIKYTAVIIIGVLDSLFEGIKSETTKEPYSHLSLLAGLISNIILALGITLLGERLGLDLYLAVTIVFILRIFANLGITRQKLLEIFTNKRKKQSKKIDIGDRF